MILLSVLCGLCQVGFVVSFIQRGCLDLVAKSQMDGARCLVQGFKLCYEDLGLLLILEANVEHSGVHT